MDVSSNIQMVHLLPSGVNGSNTIVHKRREIFITHFSSQKINNMKNIVYISVLFTLICSCSQNKQYPKATLFGKDDFETIEIKGENIEFDDMIMNPSQLMIYDTFLITYNNQAKKLFHIFSLPNKKKIGERITMGQGPMEMLMPTFINQDDSVSIFDMMDSRLFKYSISEFVNNPTPNPSSIIQIENKPFWSEINMINNKFIGVSYEPDAPCFTFSPKGNMIGKFGQYPESLSQYTNLEIVDAYRAILTTNKKDRVAVCHFFTDLIDLYDENGVLVKELHGPDHFFTSFKEFNDGQIIGSKAIPETYRDAFYSPINVGEEFFVLYNGKYLNEPGYDLLATDIFAFDWNGNPTRHFVLDQGVLRIAVDKKNKKIYGISDNPEYHIVEFSY